MYVGALSGATRPIITPATAGSLTRPTSGVPSSMYYLGGVTNATLAFNDGETEYYLLGNGGFADGVKVTQRCQASITSYFQKDLDGSSIVETGFDEAMDVILRARTEKNLEVYVEIFKFLGGTTYDLTCFAATVTNYNESYPADNLVETTFDMLSRGTYGAGRVTITGAMIPTTPNA